MNDSNSNNFCIADCGKFYVKTWSFLKYHVIFAAVLENGQEEIYLMSLNSDWSYHYLYLIFK